MDYDSLKYSSLSCGVNNSFVPTKSPVSRRSQRFSQGPSQRSESTRKANLAGKDGSAAQRFGLRLRERSAPGVWGLSNQPAAWVVDHVRPLHPKLHHDGVRGGVERLVVGHSPADLWFKRTGGQGCSRLIHAIASITSIAAAPRTRRRRPARRRAPPLTSLHCLS